MSSCSIWPTSVRWRLRESSFSRPLMKVCTPRRAAASWNPGRAMTRLRMLSADTSPPSAWGVWVAQEGTGMTMSMVGGWVGGYYAVQVRRAAAVALSRPP
jgi:hypothetical protein